MPRILQINKPADPCGEHQKIVKPLEGNSGRKMFSLYQHMAKQVRKSAHRWLTAAVAINEGGELSLAVDYRLAGFMCGLSLYFYATSLYEGTSYLLDIPDYMFLRCYLKRGLYTKFSCCTTCVILKLTEFLGGPCPS